MSVRSEIAAGPTYRADPVSVRRTAADRQPRRPVVPHLDLLESESIHIIREVAAEFERPVLLFSGGRTAR